MTKTAKNNIILLVLIILNCCFVKTTYGQIQFTSLPQSITNIPSQYSFDENVRCKWADFDNDNDLDFILYASDDYRYPQYTNVFINNGNDSFNIANFVLTPLTNIWWGDFDNNGYLDFLANIKDTIVIFKNNLPLSSGFTRIDTCYNPSFGTQGWSNIFNKGKFDVLNNYSPALAIMTIIFNEKNGISVCGVQRDSFTASGYKIAGLPHYIDINNDGYFDLHNIASESYTYNSQYTIINKGLGSDTLFQLIQNTCNFYKKVSSIFGDIDNDGYLDDGISGKSGYNSYFNKLYKNNHNNTYSEKTNTGIPDTLDTKQYFFDYDNNGLIDILISNENGVNTIYKNNGNYNFTKDTTITNLNYSYKVASAADYDNDGDLDLLLSGLLPTQPGRFTALYRNDSTPPNTPPTAPQTMWTTMDSTKVIFHWRRATDVEAPQITLSYNLMVGTSPKAIDITSPMADTVTGFRRVVELGNAQLNNFYILDKSIFNIGDTVYWSVQTIDNGFGYSSFSKESSAIISGRMEAPLFDTLCSNDSLLWRGSYYKTTGRHRLAYGLATAPDSVFFLDLKVNPSYIYETQAYICSGSSYTWNGNTYYNSGTYQVYNTTTKGCDSLDRLVLNVRPDYTTQLTEQLCMGDSIWFAGQYLKTAGLYWDSLQSIYGCDSLLHLTLSLAPTDTNITISGDTLYATPQNANFRWWNCDKQSFEYAASQSWFAPFQNGNFAAEISSNGCTYLTQCYEITGLAMPDTKIPNLEINLMPNPNDGAFYLELKAQGKQEYRISVFDALGKEVYKQNMVFENYKKLKLDLSAYGSGVYQLRIVSEEGVTSRRVIIR